MSTTSEPKFGPSGPQIAPHAFNRLFAALGELVVPNSCDLVVVEGRLDPDTLRAAISAALAQHPVLCRPLVPSVETAPSASGERELPIDFRLHRLDHDEPTRVDAHLLALIWDEPLRPTERPVRFHLTWTPRRTYFQTIHTHVYADATACYTLTQDIARFLASADGPRPIPAPSSAPTVARFLHASRSFGREIRALALVLRDWTAKYGGLAARGPSAAETRAGPRRFARIVLSPEETDALRRAARSRGCSMHALFQLALVRSASRDHRGQNRSTARVRFWDFFSLRPFLSETQPTYDCLALIHPVELDPRAPDDAILERCTERVAEMRRGALVDHAHRFDLLFRALDPIDGHRTFLRLWPALFKSDVFFTNPGVCPSRLERFGEAKVVDYVTFPQLFPPANLMFIFSTFRDSLRILVIHDEDVWGTRLSRDLLAPFLEYLGASAQLRLDPSRFIEGFVARWTPVHASRPLPPMDEREAHSP